MEQSIQLKILTSLSADAIKYFFPGYVSRKEDSGIRFRTSETEPQANSSIRFSIIAKEIQAAIPPGDFALEGTYFSELSIEESSPEPVESELDPKTKAILDEIEALKEKYGITIEELEAVLSYSVKLSRLRITRHRAIILEDYDHQEVKMDTLTKAVFLLFLKHPEGIRYKELCDHRDELEGIYCSISGRTDLSAIRKSISDLTDSITSNSINEKVSKTKKAFRDVIDDRVAKFYYIDGKQGTAKKIALDRSLVIWE